MSAPARKVVHSDIKLENPPHLASHYLDVPNMPWASTKFPGIEIKVLYSDDSGITTALFKLAPGAVVPLHAAPRSTRWRRARNSRCRARMCWRIPRISTSLARGGPMACWNGPRCCGCWRRRGAIPDIRRTGISWTALLGSSIVD